MREETMGSGKPSYRGGEEKILDVGGRGGSTTPP